MGRSIPNDAATTPDGTLVTPRPKAAKATLRGDTASQASAGTPHKGQQNSAEKLSAVVSESARRVYGKQGAAAAQLGKDEGNFARDLKARRLTLGQLEALGDIFLAELGRGLLDQYGPVLTPKDRARRYLRELRRLLDELEQALLEDVA